MAPANGLPGIAALSMYADDDVDDSIDALEEAPVQSKQATKVVSVATLVNSTEVRAQAAILRIADYGGDDLAESDDDEEEAAWRSSLPDAAPAEDPSTGANEGAVVARADESAGAGQGQAGPLAGAAPVGDGRDGGGATTSPEVAATADCEGGVETEQYPWMPPRPKEKCSDELQEQVIKFLNYKRTGKSINAQLRMSRGYRNPDFLHKMVDYLGIDQIGSLYPPELFDPHGYSKDDFYDNLLIEQRREADRKDVERKKAGKIEFARAGVMMPSDATQQATTGSNMTAVGAPSALPIAGGVLGQAPGAAPGPGSSAGAPGASLPTAGDARPSSAGIPRVVSPNPAQVHAHAHGHGHGHGHGHAQGALTEGAHEGAGGAAAATAVMSAASAGVGTAATSRSVSQAAGIPPLPPPATGSHALVAAHAAAAAALAKATAKVNAAVRAATQKVASAAVESGGDRASPADGVAAPPAKKSKWDKRG